ncbi:MAG TPA: tRNA (adenosine(37)-N6)-dimethylallyltransferase MiaA [Candidatus Limnocylindria bacterium]|jgi:tRNA dimethylallyltransferase
MAPRAARRRPPPPIAAIVGPTGSGKSDLAMAIAARQPVEIIVADSRQVYRGMDLGTAKAAPAERAAVPHHLLDLVDPDEPFTLADWLAAARAVVPQVAARGRLPLLVGGTGLYVTALVDGYALPGGPPSPEVRRRLVEEMDAEGLAPLAERLRRDAPQVAATTDLRNPRRVIRALERAAGGSAAQTAAKPYPGRVALLGIRRPRAALYRSIDARAAAMFAGGLLDEVDALRRAGFSADLAPMTGHGYREAARVLAGEWSVERAIEVTARHTRQYAKRQLSWLRRDTRIVWLDAGDRAADDPALVAQALDLLGRMLAE